MGQRCVFDAFFVICPSFTDACSESGIHKTHWKRNMHFITHTMLLSAPVWKDPYMYRHDHYVALPPVGTAGECGSPPTLHSQSHGFPNTPSQEEALALCFFCFIRGIKLRWGWGTYGMHTWFEEIDIVTKLYTLWYLQVNENTSHVIT